jgi:hypothetical protein
MAASVAVQLGAALLAGLSMAADGSFRSVSARQGALGAPRLAGSQAASNAGCRVAGVATLCTIAGWR